MERAGPTQAAAWDTVTYQSLAVVAAATIVGFHFLRAEATAVPLWERLALAGALVAYAVAVKLVAAVRRRRAEVFEALSLVAGLWTVRVAAAWSFAGDQVLVLMMVAFGIGLLFRSAYRLLAFHAAMLAAIAVALATRPPTAFGAVTIMGTIAVIAIVTLVMMVARERAIMAAERLARVAARVHNGVVVTDERGRVDWVNEGFVRLSGLQPRAVLGRAASSLYDVPPSDAEAVAQLRAAIAEGRPTRQLQLAHRRTAEPIWVAVDVSPVRDANGRLEAVILVETDIGEARAYAEQLLAQRELAEDALRSTEEQLRQSQKMEAIGRLAGGVAHDFNNLLSVMLGYSTLVLEEIRDDDPQRRRIDEIRKAAERAGSLTSQLLAFSRQQVLAPRVIDLGDVAHHLAPLLRRLLSEDIALSVETAPDLGRVRADPRQMEQVLMNLAVNARDAMPDGGRLVIATRNVELDEGYARTQPEVTPGRYVLLAVSDTGVGMDEETQARVFEPFFTTKALGEGTGLGLSTVHGIVRQSEGHIRVRSELGRGTTFEVYLPRTDEVAESAELGTPPPERTGGTETILLVEDERQVRETAREVLEARGYRVLEATSGAEALQVAASTSGRIHLLVTDVVMPGMGGPELARRIVASRPETRVLYTSGYTRNAIVKQGGVLPPGVALLTKPFTAGALAQRVREILDAPEPPDLGG